jgi:hypothetical protein
MARTRRGGRKHRARRVMQSTRLYADNASPDHQQGMTVAPSERPSEYSLPTERDPVSEAHDRVLQVAEKAQAMAVATGDHDRIGATAHYDYWENPWSTNGERLVKAHQSARRLRKQHQEEWDNPATVIRKRRGPVSRNMAAKVGRPQRQPKEWAHGPFDHRKPVVVPE